MFNKRNLYVVVRLEDDIVLPDVHLAYPKAHAHMLTLAEGFTYRIDTVVLPPGMDKAKFKLECERKIRQGGRP